MTIPQEPVYVVGPRGPKGEPGGMDSEAVAALIAAALADLPPSGLTEAQVTTLVNSALSALPADGVTAMAQVTAAIATALEGYYTTEQVDAAIATAVAATDHRVIVTPPLVTVYQPGDTYPGSSVMIVGQTTDGVNRPFNNAAPVPTLPDGLEWYSVADWSSAPKASGGWGTEGGFAVAMPDGCVYFGGGDGNLVQDDGYGVTFCRFKPSDGSFEFLPDLPNWWDYGAWAVVDDTKILLLEQHQGQSIFVNVYDTVTAQHEPPVVIPFATPAVADSIINRGYLNTDQGQGFQHGRKVYFPGFGFSYDLDAQTVGDITDPGEPGTGEQAGHDCVMGLAPDGRIYCYDGRNGIYDGSDTSYAPRVFDPTDETWHNPPVGVTFPPCVGGDSESNYVFDPDGRLVLLGGGDSGWRPVLGGLQGAFWDKGDGTLGNAPLPPLTGIDWGEGVPNVMSAATAVVGTTAYLVSGANNYGDDPVSSAFGYVSPYIIPFDLVSKTWGTPVLIPPPPITANDPAGQSPTWNAGNGSGRDFIWNFNNGGSNGIVLPPLPVVEGWEFAYIDYYNQGIFAFPTYLTEEQVKAYRDPTTGKIELYDLDGTDLGQLLLGGMTSNDLNAYFTRNDGGNAEASVFLFQLLLGYVIDGLATGLRSAIGTWLGYLLNSMNTLYLGVPGLPGGGNPTTLGSDFAQVRGKHFAEQMQQGFWMYALDPRADDSLDWVFANNFTGRGFQLSRTSTEAQIRFGAGNFPALVVKDDDTSKLWWRTAADAEQDLTAVASSGSGGDASVIEQVNLVAAATGVVELPGAPVTMHQVTMADDCAIHLPTPVAGASFELLLGQGDTGGQVATLVGPIIWANGTPPTLTTIARHFDLLSFACFDGVNYIGAYQA